jgi:NAD(P)H-flavin reductase
MALATDFAAGSGADPMVPRFMPVREIWDDTDDTFTMELDPGPGGFSFRPGQFNMLYVFGVGEVPISISGDPGVPGRLLHTIRRVGPVTAAMRDLAEGDPVGVRGPYGVPWPVGLASSRDVVFMAGGIGLAPLRSALYHVLNHRNEYERIVLLYGVRSPRDLLFEDEVSEWRGRFDMEVEVTVDTADRQWRGSVGVVTRLIPRALFDPGDTIAFMCGPEIMMQFAAEALVQCGVRAGRIHLSLERNMKCGIGLCGHCQFGKDFVCTDGPVFTYEAVRPRLGVREV